MEESETRLGMAAYLHSPADTVASRILEVRRPIAAGRLSTIV